VFVVCLQHLRPPPQGAHADAHPKRHPTDKVQHTRHARRGCGW
jgi:hypothetical protein